MATTYGPWFQPPDQWVAGSCARTNVYWSRNLNWYPTAEGITNQAGFDAVQGPRVRAFFEASSPDWLALVDGDAWASASTTESFVGISPSARLFIRDAFSAGSSANDYIRGGWGTLTGSIDEGSGPLVGPTDPLLPTQTVEYEAAVGSYSATERQYLMRSTYSNSGYLDERAVMWTPGSATALGPYPWTGRAYAAWNESPAVAQSTLHIVTSAASSIIAMPVYKSWFNHASVDGVQTLEYRLFRNAANSADEAPTYRVLYTPPRYRIVTTTSGMYYSRQRQHPAGNAGGYPSRQRQNGGHTGAWPSRQRQAGR